MGTKLHLKVTGFSICLILTFGIAGLHARGSAVKKVDTVRELQEPPQAIDSVSLTKEAQNLSLENIHEPEAVDEPDMPQSIPKPVTTPRKELSVKQVRKNEKPVMVMASADTKTIKKTEKLLGSAGVRRDDASVLKKEKSKTIVLTQHKTAEKEDSKTSDVPDNMVQNDRSENIEDNSKKEDIDTAIAELSRQIELNDSDAGWYVLRGNLHMDKQDYGQAVKDYTKAIEINPDEVAAYNNRGQAYKKTGKYKKAIRDFKKAIKKDPENIYAYINRGNTNYTRQHYRKATSDYTRAIKIDPEFSLAYINRGIAYYQRNNFSKAVKDFSKVLELNAGDAGIYMLRGDAYNSEGEYRQAINDYDKALEKSPGLVNAYNNRGMAYEGMGELDKAIRDYSKAIEDFSRAPELNEREARVTLTRGPAFHGISSHFPKYTPTHGKPFYALGSFIPNSTAGFTGVLRRPGIKSSADLAYFSKLREKDSEFSDPYINRGRLYIKAGQLDKALSDVSKAIEINPDSYVAYNYRSEIYRKMGKKAESQKDWRMAMQLRDVHYKAAYFKLHTLGLAQELGINLDSFLGPLECNNCRSTPKSGSD